jgi:methanethiol S-methyltransferase
MIARLLILLYGLVSYAVFVVSMIYAPGFFGNTLVSKTIDVGRAVAPGQAILVNLQLIGLFAIQHSIMARQGFKRWWAKHLPAPCQRSTYVLLSSLLLLLLFWQWRPIPTVVWTVDGIAGWLLVGLYWCGWSLVLASSYMIDHFDLFGLRQTFSALRGAEPSGQPFRTPLLYKIVRHPLMLGFLIVFWATPEMTAGHLLFAVVVTIYVLVALHFEERDLISQFGVAYQQYRQRVPMLLPHGRRPTGVKMKPAAVSKSNEETAAVPK